MTIFCLFRKKEKGVNKLHAEIVHELKNMLDDNNVLIWSIRMTKQKGIDHGNLNISF